MNSKTSELFKLINQYDDIPDRLNQLKDYYKGETCYIVSAGPSLKKYERKFIKEKLKDKLVICVKQAYTVLEEIADFHVLNLTNFQPYDYKDLNTIVVWEVFEQFHPQLILSNNLKCDLMLPVIGNHNPDIVDRINNSQAGKLNFDDFTLDKTLNRMYGPGIMYETVIHLALYLGVSEIITLGWDIGDVSKFKGNDLKEDVWQDHFYEGYEGNNLADKISYAPTPMNFHEVNTVVNSTKTLNEWLLSQNVKLSIISDTNPAHESIPRTEL
jgi:hypothetical protein